MTKNTVQPLFKTIELNLGQAVDVRIDDAQSVRVELINLTSEVYNAPFDSQPRQHSFLP